MLVGYIEHEKDEKKRRLLKAITSNLVKHNVLEAGFVARYFVILNELSFDSAIHYYGTEEATYDRIISTLETYRYEKQNSVIDFLKKGYGIEFVSGLASEKQFYLGRLIQAATRSDHWNSERLIQGVVSGSVKYADHVKAGIAYGAFITVRNMFSLDELHTQRSIKLLNSIDEEVQIQTYELINQAIDINSPDSWEEVSPNEQTFTELSEKVIKSIENIVESNKTNFKILAVKIKAGIAVRNSMPDLY